MFCASPPPTFGFIVAAQIVHEVDDIIFTLASYPGIQNWVEAWETRIGGKKAVSCDRPVHANHLDSWYMK